MTLLHHWKLDETSGTAAANSTGGAAGLYARDASLTTIAGPGGQALFGFNGNGTSDWVDIANAAISFASGDAFGFSLWFKLDDAAEQFMGRTNNTAARLIALSDTSLRGHVSSDYACPSMGTVNWHHLAASRTTGNSLRMFLDGTEAGSAISLAVVWAPTNIGRVQGAFMHGYLSNIKVFDTDIVSLVSSLFDEGKPQNSVIPTVGGTVAHGQVLTVTSDGTWSDGSTAARQWRVANDAAGAGVANIAGETGTTYTVDEAEVSPGKFVSVRITRTNNIGSLTADSIWRVMAGGNEPETRSRRKRN